MIEEVRSRILCDATLINRNTIELSWYGDEVSEIGIYKKMSIDDDYTLVSNHLWGEGKAQISLDSSEYDIIILGANSSGESSVMTIGEVSFIDIKTAINIAINEKIYDFSCDFTETYRFNVDF